jgi:GlpG protein
MHVKLRITYNAPVVLTFALIATVVQILPDTVKATWFTGYPSLKYGLHAYVGLFTHIFGHANWDHLLGNMMLLLLIGPILEERHGSLSLFFMIAITALAEGLANVAMSSAIIGASGVVFMMIILASTANIRAGDVPLTFIAIVVLYMGREIVGMGSDDHISHFTHLVGGLAGAGFGFFGAAAPKDKGKKPEPIKPTLPIATASPAPTRRSPGTAATSDPLRKS